jgi:hypothetical protein
MFFQIPPKVAVLVRHFLILWLMIYHPVSKTVKCLNLLMMIFKTNLPKFRFLEKIIPTVLFGDNKNPHVKHHLLILSRSCCILFCRCFKLGPELTWLTHIQYIHTKCNKILNCMRLLIGTKWGANSYTLRTIYFALIR